MPGGVDPAAILGLSGREDCGYSLKEPLSRARRLWVARVKESQEEMHRFFGGGGKKQLQLMFWHSLWSSPLCICVRKGATEPGTPWPSCPERTAHRKTKPEVGGSCHCSHRRGLWFQKHFPKSPSKEPSPHHLQTCVSLPQAPCASSCLRKILGAGKERSSGGKPKHGQ